MAVNVTMDLMRTLIAQLDPKVKIESCQVVDTRRSSRRADAVASYRVYVTGVATHDAATPTPWTRALLLKCVPSPTEPAVDAQRWLRNETAVHTRALPALMGFQASRHVTTPFLGAASCVAARAGKLLALDDAEALGFHPASGVATSSLDADQCDAALRELARLHALSLAMRRIRPAAFKAGVMDCVKEVVFLPELEHTYLTHCCRLAEDAYSMVAGSFTSPSTDANERRYLEHFQRFVDEPDAFFGRMTELAVPREPLSVLCHGACVPQNILFLYDDDGRVKEVRFVEFSAARFASLALDVATLVCCCASHELRAQRLPRMLAEYHGVLVAQLAELLPGAADPCLEDDPLEPHALWQGLQVEFHRCCRFGLGLAMDALASGPRFMSVATSGHDVSPRRPSAGSEARRCKLAELVQELTDNGDL